MPETKSEEAKKEPKKITSFDQLKPGKLYRLHVHEENEKKEVTEVRTRDFYIEKKIDPMNNRFRFERNIQVRILHETKLGSDALYASYWVGDLGQDFVKGSDQVLRNQDLEPLLDSSTVAFFTEIEDSGRPESSPRHLDPSYHNWVEEIGPKP